MSTSISDPTIVCIPRSRILYRDGKADLEKKTTLLLAIEDSNFTAIRDHLAVDSTKDFLSSLTAIDQHATMFTRNANKNERYRPRNNNDTQTQAKGGDRYKKKNDNNNNYKKKQNFQMLPREVWALMPEEARKAFLE